SVESVMEIVSKNSFLLCFPRAFPRLASAKVRTFLITQKAFPFFSYKKGNFFQIKEGTQFIYIRARREKKKKIREKRAAPFPDFDYCKGNLGAISSKLSCH
ncbi:MAG: hypothetical protein MR881_06730, partial [Bacteroidales bacterium]|nr:hypothetical protein [Bacteroidales bacterium]